MSGERVLVTGGVANPVDVDVVEADLTRDDGWPQAVAGTDFVLHVASPFPASCTTTSARPVAEFRCAPCPTGSCAPSHWSTPPSGP